MYEEKTKYIWYETYRHVTQKTHIGMSNLLPVGQTWLSMFVFVWPIGRTFKSIFKEFGQGLGDRDKEEKDMRQRSYVACKT